MGNEATHAQKAPTAIAEEEKSNNGSSRGPRNSELSIHERPSRERLVQHLRAPIRVTYLAELELLLLTFCTGIQDAVTFPDYHCFASNQTGNTVMLALATTVPKLEGSLFITKNIAVSLVLFLAGGWLTGQVSHHFVNKRSRLWLVFCNFLQSVMVFGAAGLQFKYGVHEKGVEALGVLALLAFASGSQVVQSRSLQMTEISTAMATAAWVDLMIDSKLFQLRNRPRNRRAFFLLSLVAGSFVGAAMYRTTGSAWAIFVSAVGKFVVSILYLFNGTEERKPSGMNTCLEGNAC